MTAHRTEGATVAKTAQDVIDEQGWNDDTLLDLALEYIENQSSPQAWTDFLLQRAESENQEHTMVAMESDLPEGAR